MLKANKFAVLEGLTFPVFVRDGRPVFQPKHSHCPHTGFVISTPKAGTYLIGSILESLGLIFAQVHLSDFDVLDQRFASLYDLRTNPDLFRHECKLRTSLSLLSPGQFSLGHIPHTPEHRLLLGSFRKVFVTRNCRDTIISAVRYYGDIAGLRSQHTYEAAAFKDMEMGEEKILTWLDIWGREFVILINSMQAWRQEDVLSLSFESLKSTETVTALSQYFGLPHFDPDQIMHDALQRLTPTSNDTPSRHQDWWTDKIEMAFQVLGFKEIP